MKPLQSFSSFLLLLMALNCSAGPHEPTGKKDKKKLEKIKLPEGFSIDFFSDDVPNARSLARGAKGTIFVATRSAGEVYALVDKDGDYKADEKYTLAKNLNMPNGVAFRDGSLYVAELSRIIRFDNIESKLDNPPEPVVILEGLPTDRNHGWKYIEFGPDDMLYVPVGAPCNICLEDDPYASILKVNPADGKYEVFARGVRNTVGFDWHPKTKELWFTDNGRDWLGDDLPPDELNHAPKAGMHFGYPFCHAGEISDPEFGSQRNCEEFTPPAQKLAPHAAAIGMTFYQGKMFPKSYRNTILIAEHGSWNRSEKIGYRVTMVPNDGKKAKGYEVFAEGWLDDGEPWGRPVDVMNLPDGSILVSDDLMGAVYRISYKK